MDGISAASAILGVAQIGLQFSQVLVTVIGDYRDAAKNINRLRDEIHLTSICLQQLGELAKQDLLRQYGILEATNLRERCNATFWEIRSAVRKGDLHSSEITKDQIDVSYFTAWKWALYTKNKLEEPRQELDRLKNSMTLCFVSHMAILATNDLERAKYAAQIPGIKKSIAWSDSKPTDDYFEKRLKEAGIDDEQIAKILGRDYIPPEATVVTVEPDMPVSVEPILKAWSIAPLTKTAEIPLASEWLERYLKRDQQGDEDILNVQSSLHPWFQNEMNNLPLDPSYVWSTVHLRQIFRHHWRRRTPQSLQVVMKGVRPTVEEHVIFPQAVTYKMEEPILFDDNEDVMGHPESHTSPEIVIEHETDEDIIANQLALYQ